MEADEEMEVKEMQGVSDCLILPECDRGGRRAGVQVEAGFKVMWKRLTVNWCGRGAESRN